MSKHTYTKEEVEFIKANYNALGPTEIAKRLNLSLAGIEHKGIRLGLYRGQKISNTERRNIWKFSTWSYELGYLVGVYLGDGNVGTKDGRSTYFRLGTIDLDFAINTGIFLYKITNFKPSIKLYESKNQYILTLANKDFANWLRENFGGAKEKRIYLLPSYEANLGLIEGIFDSEGTVMRYIFKIRMENDLKWLEELDEQLNICHSKRFQGITNENWQSPTFKGFGIPNKEYTRIGLGTYIKRKAKNGINYKGINLEKKELYESCFSSLPFNFMNHCWGITNNEDILDEDSE